MFSQNINFTTNLSDKFNHEGPIEGISDFTSLNGGYYYNYSAISENMVFYPDIERSREHSTFYQLNSSTLELTTVGDKETRFQLFNQTDFRTKYNPIYDDQWIYDAYDHSEPDSIEEKVIYLFSAADRSLKGDTIKFLRREATFKIHQNGFLSDVSSKRGLYFSESDVKGDFLKLFFLEVQDGSIKSTEKTIKYSDLGFSTSEIRLCNSYGFENNGKIGNELFTTFYFNLNKDKSLGVSTIFFDLSSFEYRIVSAEIKDKIPFLPDFNEITATSKIKNGEIHMFIDIKRQKISQGEKTNTPYDVASSEDIIIWKLGTPGSDAQIIRNAKNNLELIFMTDNGYIMVYNGNPQMKDLLEGQRLKDRGWSKISIVQIEEGKKYLHEFPLYKYGTLEKEIRSETYYALDNEDVSDGIDFCIYYSGEYSTGITDYRVQMVHLDL